MSKRQRNDESLNDLEAALASLSPRDPRVDRDALMYRSGQATASRVRSSVLRSQLWPAATLAFASLSLALMVQLIRQPSVPFAEQASPATSPANLDEDPPSVEPLPGDPENQPSESAPPSDIASTTRPLPRIPLSMGPFAGGGSMNYLTMREWMMAHPSDSWWNLPRPGAAHRTREPQSPRPPATLRQQRREFQHLFNHDWVEPERGETS